MLRQEQRRQNHHSSVSGVRATRRDVGVTVVRMRIHGTQQERQVCEEWKKVFADWRDMLDSVREDGIAWVKEDSINRKRESEREKREWTIEDSVPAGT